MDRFLFVCGTSTERGGGGPAGEHGDPTLFLGHTEPMGLRPSPRLLLGEMCKWCKGYFMTDLLGGL